MKDQAQIVGMLAFQIRFNRNEENRHRFAADDSRANPNLFRYHRNLSIQYQSKADQTQYIADEMGLHKEVDEKRAEAGPLPFATRESFNKIKAELGA